MSTESRVFEFGSPAKRKRHSATNKMSRRQTVVRIFHLSIIPVFLSIAAVFAAPQDFSDNADAAIQPLSSINTTEETRIEDLSPSNNYDVTRAIRDDVTTEFDQSETTTDPPEVTSQSTSSVTTEKYVPKKPSFIKPKSKFVSKLSYFNKASVFDGNAATNLLERTGKRQFKSRCRCEKIWNCPKLQVTVPRCPNEYFLCCF